MYTEGKFRNKTRNVFVISAEINDEMSFVTHFFFVRERVFYTFAQKFHEHRNLWKHSDLCQLSASSCIFRKFRQL